MAASLIKILRSRRIIVLAMSVGLLSLTATGLWLVSATDWFHQMMRESMISSLEEAVGTQVELDDFSFSLFSKSIVIKNLLIRQEKTEKPLLTIDSLRLKFGLNSLLRRPFTLQTLELMSPQLSIYANEDDLLSLPNPPLASDGNLFDLIVTRFEINHGSILWNGLRYDLSLLANDVDIQTRYETETGRYWASIQTRVSAHGSGIGALLPSLAQAQFYIYRDRIELTGATITSGRSFLQADGEITTGIKPAAELYYTAELSLNSPLVAAYLPGFSTGTAIIKGSLNWQGTQESLAYRGRIRVGDAKGVLGSAHVELGSASSQYWGGGNKFNAAPIRITALESTFLGSLTVENLNTKQNFHLTGQVDGLTFGSKMENRNTGLSLVGGKNFTLPWVGSLDAAIDVTGTPDIFTADVSIALAEKEEILPEQIPLKGLANLQYRSQTETIYVEQLDLETPAAQARLSGNLRPGATSEILAQIEFKTENDLRMLAQLMGVPIRDLPFQFASGATFDGVLRGVWVLSAFENWTLDGQVEVPEFRLFNAKFERLTTQLKLSASMAHLRGIVIEGAGGRALFTLDLPLWEGTIASDLPLSADLTIEDLPASHVFETMGQILPISGVTRGKLAVRGTAAEPQVSSDFGIHDGQVWGLTFDRLSGLAEHTHGRFALRDLVLTNDDGRINAYAGFDSDTQQFRLGLRTQAWPVKALPTVGAVSGDLKGTAHFNLTGSGQLGRVNSVLQRLQLRGTWGIVDLSVAERELGKLSGAIETIGTEVALSWQGDILDGRFEGKATVAAQGPLTGEARFQEVSAAALTKLVGVPLKSLSGQVAGSCTFSNPSLQPEDFRAEGVITHLEAGLSEIPGVERGYEIWNPFPMRWSYTEKNLHLDRMRLLGDGTDIEINGTIGFTDPGEVDVDVIGTFNLAAVESFRPELTAAGSSTIEIHAGGAPNSPIVTGLVQLKDGTLRSEDFPNGLSQINGQVIFGNGRAQIKEVTMETGGGALRVTGNADFLENGPVRYRFNAAADDVRVRHRDSISTVFNGNLTLSGVGTRGLLGGEVVINRASINPGVDLGNVIAMLGDPSVPPPNRPILSNLQLNVQVRSVSDLDVDTSMVRDMESRIDLRLTGTALQPSLLGRVSITEGQVDFRGTSYHINRGDIDFVNPFRVDPTVNFELETRVRDVDVAVFLSGPAQNMNLSFRSDPPMQFNELISLIAIRRTPSLDPVFAAQQTIAQQHLLQAGASTVLSNALSRPTSGRLSRFFGVSRLRVDPQAGGAESDTSARIATEQQITSDLTLMYSYNLSSAQQQAVRIEWTPNRRWSVIFTRDENGLVGGDFLYKKRLR